MEMSMGPGNMSFGSFKSTLGTLLIAVILNTFLYGIVVFQYASYYTARMCSSRPFPKTLTHDDSGFRDPSMSIVYLIWLYLIEGFNNPRSNLDVHWPLPLSILVGDYRRVLAFLSTGLFSVAIFGTVRVFMMENQLERGPIDDILLTIWKPLEAFLNLVLAGLLLFAMRSAAGTSQSDRIFKRLARMSIQTGEPLQCGSSRLMVMTLWLAKPKPTSSSSFFPLPISRVYTSTLLDTLITMMSSKATNGMSRVRSIVFHATGRTLRIYLTGN
ncbi:hypothetical protein BKA70DRAFT_1306853 [Coprinopsis sp. MPI-PUGE-AT-0042]|nr:hypothetical protein BKA70DRAFT_1306853 [Coprinopsis sp. MPI-PUGE-AT-0042]